MFQSHRCFFVEVFYDLNSSAILKSFFFFLYVFFFIHEVFVLLWFIYRVFIERTLFCSSYANASRWHKSFQLAHIHTHTTYNNIKGINISDFFCYFLCLLFVHNLHPVGSPLLLLFEVEYKAK